MAAPKMPKKILAPLKKQRRLVPKGKRKSGKTKGFTPGGVSTYEPEYAEIVYNLLANSKSAKTREHCCRALGCSMPTLHKWQRDFPDFKDAMARGMSVGAALWRDRIAEHAFTPTAQVNNGLIKLLSSNVYGIKDDLDPVIVVNNNSNTDVEQLLRDRGIPMPEIPIDDIDEGE